MRQVRREVLWHFPSCAHISERVELAVDVYAHNVEVVTALGIGNATQQRHHERTAGRQFVGGVGDAAVVNTTSKDLVLEEVPVFFRDVADGDELFVLNVGGRHSGRVPTCPVQCTVEDVPPTVMVAQLTAGV